jgi:hypothetical protein
MSGPPRPKARTLTVDERNQLLVNLTAAISCSPILTAFSVQRSGTDVAQPILPGMAMEPR